MKLKQNIERKDIYSKEIEVELTVGELLMLIAIVGNNSNSKAEEVFSFNDKTRIHKNFKDRIIRDNLNDKLYNDLCGIHGSLNI